MRRTGMEVFWLTHVVPFHSQVSPTRPAVPSPPVSYTAPNAAWYVSRWYCRAEGEVVGTRCTQFVPVYSHVSPPPTVPPKSTTRCRTGSYAIECPCRAAGLVVGKTWFHVVPLYSHVSPRLALAPTPPKSTVTCRVESYAIACEPRAGGPEMTRCRQSGNATQLEP